MLHYSVRLTKEKGKVLVSFKDFPMVNTYGDDEAEAW